MLPLFAFLGVIIHLSSQKKWKYFIDASVSNTGITIIHENTCLIFSLPFSKIPLTSLTKLDKQVEKFRGIQKVLNRVISDYPPDNTIVMEGIFVQPRFLNSSEVLLKLHGFLMGYFSEYHLEYIPPSNIKKAVTGKGNASKKQVRDMLEETCSVSFLNDDQSDSFALFWAWNQMQDKAFDIKKVKIIVEDIGGDYICSKKRTK